MTEDDPKNAKKCRKYFCKKCLFSCSKKSNWDKHVLTQKHKMDDQGLLFTVTKNAENAEKMYLCKCGKKYKYKQGLFTNLYISYFDIKYIIFLQIRICCQRTLL